jgi:hypothetical protein
MAFVPAMCSTTDLIRLAVAVKMQHLLSGASDTKKRSTVRGAPSSLSRDKIKRRRDCSEQDIGLSGSDAQILLTKGTFKS